MKFATAKPHRDFFQKNGWIEFENFLTSSQTNQLRHAIDDVLTMRADAKPDRLHLVSPDTYFLKGRDLWRAHEKIQKMAGHPRFAEIASELIEKKPLRLAYDQIFPSFEGIKIALTSSKTYENFLNQTISLEEVSCVQGIACGLMIALNDAQEVENAEEGIDIFPKKLGQAIFFQPNASVNWHHLYNHIGQKFYLIAYCQATAYYQLNPQDPHTHALKQLGYIFNDKLSDKLNPIVFR